MTEAAFKKLIRENRNLEAATPALRQLLLRHGTFFARQADIRHNSIASAWKRRTRPKPKRCFFNAQKFAKENLERNISYWEGVAASSNMTFFHAWNTIGDDLIDLTLTDSRLAYFGVKIDRYFLLDHEGGRWDSDELVRTPCAYLLEYFKDGRCKEYPLPSTE